MAFTVSTATVAVITLCPWCPCNTMKINDREGRYNLDCMGLCFLAETVCEPQNVIVTLKNDADHCITYYHYRSL